MSYIRRSTRRLWVHYTFKRNVFLIFLFVALLSACSGLTTIYYRLDWWAGQYIDDFVELNKTQHAHFQRAFKMLHRQHCERDIPRYIEILSDARRRIPLNDFPRDYLAGQFQSLRDQWHLAIEEAAPAAAAILVTLDAEQVRELNKNFTRANREHEQRYGTTMIKREHTRRRAFEKRLRYWLGDLTPEQLFVLDDWQKNWVTDEPLATVSRQAWQSELITLLDRRDERVESDIQNWVGDYRRYRSQAYQTAREANEEITLKTLAGILSTLNSGQKRYFLEVIDTWDSRLKAIDCMRLPSQ